MKTCRRISVLSISALVATILTVSATGVIAQWSGEVDGFSTTPILGHDDSNATAYCDITIVKEAIPADGTDFVFERFQGTFTLDDAVPDDGDAYGDSILFSLPWSLGWSFIERPRFCWSLHYIACEVSEGVDAIPLADDNNKLNGVRITPVDGGEARCTFNNQRDTTTCTFLYLPVVSNSFSVQSRR